MLSHNSKKFSWLETYPLSLNPLETLRISSFSSIKELTSLNLFKEKVNEAKKIVKPKIIGIRLGRSSPIGPKNPLKFFSIEIHLKILLFPFHRSQPLLQLKIFLKRKCFECLFLPEHCMESHKELALAFRLQLQFF